MDKDETAEFILGVDTGKNDEAKELHDFVTKKYDATMRFWKIWMSKINYTGRWREMVKQSALILKLFTSKTEGSIIASPTYSLPEYIGGSSNWDYRFVWLRDASFACTALTRLGFMDEAKDYMHWLEHKALANWDGGFIGVLFSIDGGKAKEEEKLKYFEGFKKSSPVRIGNAAYKQVQLDVYGEMFDSIYIYHQHKGEVTENFWQKLFPHLNWVCQHWNEKDEGIWEIRKGKKHFLYSRLMCWVALDRGIKIAEDLEFKVEDNWILERDKIKEDILKNFWDDKRQTFVHYLGTDSVDAGILLMLLTGFIDAKDPRWLSTLKVIEEDLVSDSMVYRHKGFANDGLKSGVCTFWYIESLSRSGFVQKARFAFEKMLTHANHLGLYSEQFGFKGEHLGNYPQALTHLGLINAALFLNDNLNKKGPEDNLDLPV